MFNHPHRVTYSGIDRWGTFGGGRRNGEDRGCLVGFLCTERSPDMVLHQLGTVVVVFEYFERGVQWVGPEMGGLVDVN
jgi:hypothetical protein